jgi:hypothetical protein
VADQRITQLVRLTENAVAANDVLPIVDISSSETKKVTAKDLFEAGAALADAASIDLVKLDQSSTTKLGTTALADDAITAAKLANDSSINYGPTEPSADNFEGRGHVNSTTKYLKIYDGSVYQQVIAPTAGIENLAITTGKLAANAVTTAKVDASGLGTAAIADSAITAIKIADGTITSSKFQAGAVDNTAIGNLAVNTAELAASAVTYEKLQNVTATGKLLGRATAGAGIVEEITCTSAGRALLDDADASAQRTTLGLGTLATQSGTFTGTHSGTSSGSNTGDQTITLTGHVTGSGTGSLATTIADNAITTAKVADGAITTAELGAGAVTGAKLAASSSTIVSGNAPSFSGDFTGQQWVNIGTGLAYTWTGSAWVQQAGVQTFAFADSTPLNFSAAVSSAGLATITSTLDTQVAATVFAGPTTGSNATPTFRSLTGTDLPIATASVNGAIQPGTGLAVTGAGVLNHSNSATPGTYTKVTIDAQGHVSSGAGLLASDVPSLDASKLTSGTLAPSLYGTNSITGIKLANYSTVQFGGAGSTSGVVTFPTPQFIGQGFFDSINSDYYLWDGNAWQPLTVISGDLIYAGTYNASSNTIATVTTSGTAAGLVVGSALPAASVSLSRFYVVVSVNGTGTAPAPTVALAAPDMLICSGTSWDRVGTSSTVAGVSTATGISVTPYGNIAATNVQTAIQELDDEKLAKVGGVITGELLIGTAGTFGFEGSTANAYETYLSAVDPTADRSIVFPDQSGTVIVSGNASILNADINASAAIAYSKLSLGTSIVNADISSSAAIAGSKIVAATTSVVGAVQLSDSTSTTSSALAATPTAVKAAYDLAAAALPKAGGIITGNLEIGTSGSLTFEGATADAFETTLTVVDPTVDRTITLPDATGTVITTGDTGTITSTMIANNTILDADINANAEIAVSKLADGAARQLLQTDAAGTGVEWASNIDIPGTLDVTGTSTFDSDAYVYGVRVGRGAGAHVGNTVVGNLALNVNTTGFQNTAVGANVLRVNNDGNYNTGVGLDALYSNTNGSANVAMGLNALRANTSGESNTAIGVNTLLVNVGGNYNTAIGQNALTVNTTGINNTAIGINALASNVSGSYNVGIGPGVSSSSSTVSNEVNIYNGSVTARFQGAASAWNFVSDARDKTDIQDLTLGLEFISALKPRRFKWNLRNSKVDIGKPSAGFIAQEVLQAVERFSAPYTNLIDTNDPNQYTFAQANMIPILVKAVQELTIMVKDLQTAARLVP